MNTEQLQLLYFVHGAIGMGSTVIGLFFLKFWRKTHDRIFFQFSVAFLIFAFERIIMLASDVRAEVRPYVFTIRLVASVLIIYAIFKKTAQK